MTVLAQIRAAPSVSPDTVAGLLALAQDPGADARQRLLIAVLALCDTQQPTGDLSIVLGEIFMTLAAQAERDVRKVLSERLSHADWAPRALINVLALDEIEIARPVLANSPVLQDEDLLRVLVEATLEHHIEVARRPNLTGRLADAIIDRNEPATLTALASNRSASVSVDGVRRLVEHSRRIAALRSPLIRHPLLTEQLAQQMYQWVGEALRQSIASRFQLDEARLGHLINEVVAEVYRGPPPPVAANDDPARDEMERRLIDKLQAAGQLRPGYLIRAVRERRPGLFAHGLAALGGFTIGQVRAALDGRTPEALYYACAAIGIDRAVFPAVLAELRALNGGPPGDSGQAVWLRGSISPASAARAFQALVPA